MVREPATDSPFAIAPCSAAVLCSLWRGACGEQVTTADTRLLSPRTSTRAGIGLDGSSSLFMCATALGTRRQQSWEPMTAGRPGDGWRSNHRTIGNGPRKVGYLRDAVAAVPELTRNENIKLNGRVSLRDRTAAIRSHQRILPASGPPAKSTQNGSNNDDDKPRLAGRLALVASHRSPSVNHRQTSLGTGLAPTGARALDLQASGRIHRRRACSQWCVRTNTMNFSFKLATQLEIVFAERVRSVPLSTILSANWCDGYCVNPPGAYSA